MSVSLVPAIAVIAVAGGGLFAQPAARPDFAEFEVASIKATPPGATGRWIRMQSTHEFVVNNHTVKTLLAAAYNLNPKAILGGPDWVDADRYDIFAKAPNEVPPTLEEQMSMLRKLLGDRFHLTFHREPREMRCYALTAAKGGAKLKESPAPPAGPPQTPKPLIFVVSPQLVRLPARGATLAEFASVLQRAALEYPVLDRTGLSARYDFDLEFTPDESVFGGALGKGIQDAEKPNLFGAIAQQLGLKLEATRGLVDALVIDRIERPSAN